MRLSDNIFKTEERLLTIPLPYLPLSFLQQFIFPYLIFAVVNRTGALDAVSDGSFGEVSAPIFIDQLFCVGDEDAIVNYGGRDRVNACRSSLLGFVSDSCGQDLGVRCPGKLLAV